METTSTTVTRLTPKAGDIVMDVSTSDTYGPRYAIGKKGFLNLETGDFLPYDSAFPGVAYFDRPEFRIEGVKREAHMSNDAAEALTEADYRWHLVANAKTVMDHGQALIDMSNAMSNLRTWHPGHQTDQRGYSTLPWEREDDDFAEGETAQSADGAEAEQANPHPLGSYLNPTRESIRAEVAYEAGLREQMRVERNG